MIDVLKLRVNKLIEENKDSKEILEKYNLIKEILNKDDCFFKYEYRVCVCNITRFRCAWRKT